MLLILLHNNGTTQSRILTSQSRFKVTTETRNYELWNKKIIIKENNLTHLAFL